MATIRMSVALPFVFACALGAQGEVSTSERLKAVLQASDAERQAGLDAMLERIRWARMPRRATTADVILPGTLEHIELRFDEEGRLRLTRREVDGSATQLGECAPHIPSAFTARAFGPNDLLVAMATGNAGPEMTVFAFVREVLDDGFELAGVERVRELLVVRPGEDDEHRTLSDVATVVAWDRASLTALVAFPSAGTSRLVIGSVPLVDTRPPVVERDGRTLRPPPMPRCAPVRVHLDAAGAAGEVELVAVDRGLRAFVRAQHTVTRRSPLRRWVREPSGAWTADDADLPGVLVEPEFTIWRGADGVLQLLTPRTTLAAGVLQQTLHCYRQDAARGAWLEVDLPFAWQGRLHEGVPLCVVKSADGSEVFVLHDENGRLVTRRRGQ